MIRPIKGEIGSNEHRIIFNNGICNENSALFTKKSNNEQLWAKSDSVSASSNGKNVIGFDSSRAVPTSNENRPNDIASVMLIAY